jgi:hypothetical protein
LRGSRRVAQSWVAIRPAEGRRAVAGRTRPPVLRRHRQGRVQAAPAERNLTCDFPFLVHASIAQSRFQRRAERAHWPR